MRAGIVDYRMGNLASVSKALEKIGVDAFVSDLSGDLARADLLILPGVGNFTAGMDNLRRLSLSGPLVDWAESGKPVIGICLGMQLLFEHSEEGNTDGLGILEGKVSRITGEVKVPHMGWNEIASAQGELFEGFLGEHFYFVHSYVCDSPGGQSRAETDYGERFTSGIQRDRIAGFQFHPEKSGENGLKLLAKSVEVVA